MPNRQRAKPSSYRYRENVIERSSAAKGET
jgi:hypothetical protein